MKKSIIKSITLGIGGLLSLSFLLGIGLSNQFNNKKDNNNALLETSVNDQFISRNYINTEGTPLPTSGTLSTGTYYLASDLTVSSQLKITSGDVIVNLNGFTLNGGGRDKGIFHVTGGTLTVNGKDETGNRGALNNGGGYYPGSGYSYGGALYITAGAATLSDLDITNCQSNWGGAIEMSNSAVTLNNCNLSNNMDTNGYGFYGVIRVGDSSAAGTGLTVNGGEMFSNDGAISVGSNAKVTINGAYIHDNEKLGVRVDASEGLKISGNTIIKDNNSSPRNLVLNNNTVKVGIVSELGNDAYIGVTISGDTKGVFTNSTDTSLNDFSKFFSDDANYAVAKNSDGQLYLSEAIATVTSGETVTEYSDISGAVSSWNSAASGATLTLLKDVTVSSTINVSTTKTFDLNGCGINANGGNFPIFTAANGSDFTLNDSGSTTHYYTLADVETNGAALATICDEATYEAAAADARGTFTGGYLTGANPLVNTGNPYPGGGIYILENGVVTMNGGTIIGNIAPNCAGGVGSYGKFIMNDGNIIHNRSRRGAVLANEGEMTINGGHISYNTGRGTDNCGTCAVINYPNCTSFVVNGGYITNNFARYAGFGSNIPTISISGNPVIKDNIGCGANGTDTTVINTLLYRRSNLNVYFDVVGELTEGAEIGVTIENISTKAVFTNSSDISYNDESKFFGDDTNYGVVKNSDGQLYLTNAVATVTSGETVTEYSDFSEAVSSWNSAASGATLTLLRDITTSDTINVNNNVTLDLNGYGIKATGIDYSVLTINNGAKLTIIDSGNTTQYFTVADRYAGNGAGFATVCDKATYDAADENLRGTFQGGYITGGNIISTGFYQNKAGAITVMQGGELDFKAGTIIGNSGGKESPGGVSSFGTFTLNGGNIIYNRGRRGSGVFLQAGTFIMNSGSIEYNTGVGANEYGTAALHSYPAESISLNGGSISHNYVKYGGIATSTSIFLSGDFVAADNVACGSTGTVAANGNIRLTDGARISGCITGNTPIGISLDTGSGAFTNNADTSINDPSKFVSDNSNYAIGVYPAGHANAGQLFIGDKVTVTYTTEYGTAPASDTVANGSIVNEPTSPSQEGYVFNGWYKDEEFENAWDFATDTVTSNTTLYAKWFDEATANVIKLINDIGDLTYDGGVNDSLDDILTAKTAYDALTPSQKAVVDKENKDVLDHDILTYRHVDNVGDLIKEIPEASDSQEYYDAVEAALAAYKALTDEEEAILNATLDFQYKTTLDDNVAAKEAIELIQDIGDVTYNGGQDDSKDDINAALDAYNNLTEEQKNIVSNVNKDVLDDSKDLYDTVDETVKLIESIGNVSHGGESDSKEAIDAAKAAFDSLTPEEKVLVASYNNSEKVLEDDEAVYGAMEAIDAIGDVDYTSESEEAIKHAQEVYDSLTEDQKEQLGDEYKNVLINAGNKYETARKQGDILFLILIIVTSLTLIGGIVFLYFLIKKKRNNNDDQGGDNSKGKPVKAYSFGGIVTSIILVSHYLDAKYITLYVLASLAIVVWIVCLILALTMKRKKAIKEEIKSQQVKEIKPQESNEDEEEVETITDEKGNIFQIRFIKSFTAKLIQSPIETKKYYEELKNEVLSYKETHSRISWHFDSVNAGRNYILKFAIRGKTLCVYLPLDSEKLSDKYKVEKVETKRYEDVPCLYRIKNDRRCGYAKDLIAMVAFNLGLEKGEEQHEVYSNLPYEENKPLIARGLIKELKVKVNKPAEAPVVLESKVNYDGDEVVLTKDSSGNIFEIRYIKSFTAKLSQSEDVVKDYYTVLKNHVLSYKDTHSRVSWHYDAINVGRDYILKFAIRGKTLCVYFALDSSRLDKKYKVEEAKGNRYIEVSCLYRIKNDRRCEYAKELIDLLMKEHGLKQGDIPNEDYHIKKESTKALLSKGLIKEQKVQVNKPAEPVVIENKINADGDEVVVTKDASGNIFEIRYIKSFTAKLSQSEDVIKKYYTILKNYALAYKGSHSRVSWHYDAVNIGRDYILKFAVRGKTLCVFYALDPSQVDEKYKVEVAKGKRFEDTPCLYRIKNDRRCEYAKELIDEVMKIVDASKGEEPNEDYCIAKESTKALLAKGLIKETKYKVQDQKVITHYESITVSKADEVMSDEKAEASIEEVEANKYKKGSKEIINIDTLSEHYNNGDEVTLDSLIEKGLVPSKVGRIKILARGELNKKLHVVANEYSLQAIKMIVLVGGSVKKIK